ncbi:MAG: response regulator receiver modulated diguanylate cyclase with sensor [Candidatus Brocadiaceae bacterium]|nr:response regulator receiver modulated diguanylate cyclase with sensor [Candidatus Brocadiaceae bacterium]
MEEKKDIRVLYIEDNEGHARLFVKGLKREGGFCVDRVAEPEAGLKMAKETSPGYDAVVVDYCLPGRNGLEVIKDIMSWNNPPATIMVTALGSEETAVDAMQAGAGNYVVKDVHSHYLALIPTVIRDAVRKRKMENDKKAVERELRRLNALLKAEQEAINSGILVVGLDAKVLRYNKRFLEIWEIPEGLVNEGDDSKLLSFVADSLSDWDTFIKQVEYLYQHPEEKRIGDIVELKSGRMLSRNTGPVRLENGEIIGRLWNFEDVTERKRQDVLIQNMAFYDYLTGLPNRRTFYDRLSVSLSDAKRNKQTLSVVFIDLDRFKQVNDTLGHEIGDKVLIAVTRAMKGHLRESDSLARIGGDEFVLLLPRIDKVEDVHRVAAKFLDTFSRPITIDGHEITIGISMGAVFYPKDGDNPEALVRNADYIMYQAKQHGGNNIKIL